LSSVLASQFQEKNSDLWWSSRRPLPATLPRLRPHPPVLSRGLADADRIFSTVGIRQREPLEALLRSPQIFEWFDSAGVDDVPSIFAGQVIEKLDLTTYTGQPGAVIVAGIVRLDDPQRWLDNVHASAQDLLAGGVTRVWTYQALDDEQELMILQEIDTEKHAKRWITYKDNVAEWMARAGVGAYPPLFVGRLADVLAVDR
jgi:hypothetical protein